MYDISVGIANPLREDINNIRERGGWKIYMETTDYLFRLCWAINIIMGEGHDNNK